MATATTRKLGANQRAALNAMARNLIGGEGTSWTLGPMSVTMRVLESLERAGLVRAKHTRQAGTNRVLRQFVLTDAGKERAREMVR